MASSSSGAAYAADGATTPAYGCWCMYWRDPRARAGRMILWDVDTQVDFMEPCGEALRPRRRETIARRWSGSSTRPAPRGVVHVASADDHELTDPEISDAPDFRNTYPPHCLRGHARRREDPRDRSSATRCRSRSCRFPPGLVPGADRGPSGAPAAEEELRRLHESEHRAAARRARPRRDRRLRRRDRRLQRRRDPRLPAAGPPRPLRRGRRPRASTTAASRPAPRSGASAASSSRPPRR